MLLGALDELKTLIGQREAFEYLMSVGDSMLKPIEVAPVTITIVVDGSTPPDADLAAKISAAFNFPK